MARLHSRPEAKRAVRWRSGQVELVRPLALLWLLLATGGCFVRKDLPVDGPVVEAVEIVGGESIDDSELLQGLATRASPTFLLMRGVVYEYEVFDQALLERDLQRVERYYRARGYYHARVSAARVEWTGSRAVRVVIIVDEGQPLRLPPESSSRLAVELRGLDQLADLKLLAELVAESPRPGSQFDEREYDEAKERMLTRLKDRGHAFASITGRVEVDLAHDEARVLFDVNPGPKATLGSIEIVGLSAIPEAQVRKALLIEPGDPYSAAGVEDARRELVNLDVFTSVRVEIDTTRPERSQVPVRFIVQEAAPRALRLGVGARLNALELSSSLTASWEHRNFLGGLRHLKLETRPGLVFLPTRIDNFVAPERALFQGSIGMTLSQPSFLEGRTKALLSTTLEVDPLLRANTGTDQPLEGFVVVASKAGLERPFFDHRLYVVPSLNWQAVVPVDYRNLSMGSQSPPLPQNAFETLLIAYPELLLRVDLRDDPLNPRNGALLSNSLQVATPALGSSLSDVRLHPEARFYVTQRRLTLAFRVNTGLLFSSEYPEDRLDDGDVQQKLLFRGFFSGGPFSNRGYAFQQVGEHRVSAVASDTLCEECLRPVGGLTSWEMSVELRFPVRWAAPLGLVIFLDSSDVRSGQVEYSLEDPHLSPGLGFRYPTPVGPVRLDIGVRLRELLGAEPPPEGVSLPELFGAPLAVHIAIGEAF